MNTANLQLETIELTDNMQSSLLNKMNNNFKKIDEAYGKLKNKLLVKTDAETLSEAIDYLEDLNETKNELDELKSKGDATESDIRSGKTALIQGIEITGTAFGETTTATENDIVVGKTAYDNEGNLITGTINKMPTINVELTGNATYKGYISGYGAGINNDGTLIIWATSNNNAFEHINFVKKSIEIGTINWGWNITSHDTNDAINVPHACTVDGLQDYKTINVTLSADSTNGTYDYVTVNVTLTAE